jgi:tetratricopeptide (TPR) repeat protein
MEKNPAEKKLLLAQQLREQGKTLQALDALNSALLAFAAQRNYSRFSHALLDRTICWQHLYQFNNNDIVYAVLHKKDAESMLEIVQNKNIKKELSGAYFVNAKANMLYADYGKAVNFFTKALKKLSPNKKMQKGDWLTNLGKAYYLNGHKPMGLKIILTGIAQLQKHAGEIDNYTYTVWLSGGYLRLAEILKKDSPAKSNNYLGMAKKIIATDPRQIIRKKQLRNFALDGISVQ